MYDDLTVKENITFLEFTVCRVKIKEKRAQLVSELGLENAVDKLVGDLPLGWKQKLSFQWLYYTNLKLYF
jgi:ABC-2 type transport system ATP-binding protein